jgi:hypothetical protein
MLLTLAPINIESMAARATLGEVLHQLQKGWITVTLDEFYKVVLTKKPKEFLDILSGQISGLLSCQSDHDYP